MEINRCKINTHSISLMKKTCGDLLENTPVVESEPCCLVRRNNFGSSENQTCRIWLSNTAWIWQVKSLLFLTFAIISAVFLSNKVVEDEGKCVSKGLCHLNTQSLGVSACWWMQQKMVQLSIQWSQHIEHCRIRTGHAWKVLSVWANGIWGHWGQHIKGKVLFLNKEHYVC